jgi:hypothetical protein
MPRSASSARDAYFGSVWRRALDRFVEETVRLADKDGSVADEQCEKINQDMIVASQAIWARPCATFDDLVLRTAVACFWNAPDSNDSLCLLSRSGDPDMALDERSLAHVVRGILDMAGLSFDADGRLI